MKTADEEKLRGRLLGRVRGHLRRRGISRGIVSGIMFVTALAGFLASVLLLKAGVEQMWLRYPLAVLIAWGAFLGLVRFWAELERATMRMDEDLGRTDVQGDEAAPARESVWRGPPPEGDPDQWKWLGRVADILSHFLEFEGCLVAAAIVAVIAMATGAAVAIGGMILQAEALLAEVLLDAVLITALYQRLRKKEIDWWTSSVLQETIKPVLMIMGCLIIAGILAHYYAPEARSVGGIWQHWRMMR
jgi:hypothetical protein